MRIIIRLLAADNTYIAFFEGSPNFFGKGNTKEAAIKDLNDKINAVLAAYAHILNLEE